MLIKTIKLWGLALMLVSTYLSAHQQKAAISTILFNDRTGNIEIMHRFIMHDAEHAVKRIFDGEADIYTSADTQQQFSQYVIDRFSLQDLTGRTLPLNQVGYEVDGQFIWVYQETPQPANLQGIVVNHQALRDIWPNQTNTVNIEGKGDIQTLMFAAGDTAQGIRFAATSLK